MSNGFVKNTFDIRQEKYRYESAVKGMTYKSVSLIDEFTPSLTLQGTNGSCVVHSFMFLAEYSYNRINKIFMSSNNTASDTLSRNGMWYLTKDLNGIPPYKNAGVSHNMICTVGMTKGLMLKSDYPETNSRNQKPTYEAMKHMNTNTGVKAHYKVTTVEGIIDALNRKLPVMFGYDSKIAQACRKTGRVPDDFDWNQKFKADHSNVIMAVDIENGEFTVANWWKDFGDNGYFLVPIDKFFPLMDNITVVIFENDEMGIDVDYWEKASLDHNLPKDIVIFGNKAYDSKWVNDSANVMEVRELIKECDNKLFIVDKDGRLTTNSELKIDEMVLFNNIGKYVIYEGEKIYIV